MRNVELFFCFIFIRRDSSFTIPGEERDWHGCHSRQQHRDVGMLGSGELSAGSMVLQLQPRRFPMTDVNPSYCRIFQYELFVDNAFLGR